MGREAIILAGGLGTRLRTAVPDLPKCMALVNGKPFLYYVMEELKQQGVDSFVFSLGYKSEYIIEYVNTVSQSLNIEFVIEREPLGTGGGIQLACTKVAEENVLVCNGDTLFKVNVDKLFSLHEAMKADCTLALKPMHNFDRYGVVECDGKHKISSFKEKQFYASGLINGGVYALNVVQFLNEHLPLKFSFEKDYLEHLYPKREMYGMEQDGYFIDIGIPEDYERAGREL